MRRTGAVAAVAAAVALALVSSGCTSGAGDPVSTPTVAAVPVVSPAGRSGKAVVVSPEDCPEPARAADGFRTASVRPSWKPLSVTEEEGTLHSGAMASDGVLWALHDTRKAPMTLRRWQDGRWETAAAPSRVKAVKALAASPGGGIWAAEPGAGSWHGTGTWKVGVREGDGWRELALALSDQEMGNSVAHAHGGWVSFGSVAVHWDGASWKRLALPVGQRPEGATDAYRLFGSGEELWAVPTEGSKAVRLRDGVSQVVEFALRIDAKEAVHGSQGGAFRPQAVAVTGTDETWVLGAAAFGTHYLDENEDTDAGRLVALRHTRGRWSCTWGPFHREEFRGAFTEAVPDGDGGLWAVTAESTLWHLRGGRWTRERLPVDGGAGEHLPVDGGAGERLPVGKGSEPSVTDLVATGREIYALGSVTSGGRSHGALWRTGQARP
ncbi:hypothetical protein AB0F88_13185 [Streptosporangium sp. NPDC023963]|uniref:hypothetical protein n=1 Tax=Streptosporangium sp. NPDC023963 TaxID=3155608 RepID=UPI00342E037B